MKALHVVAIVGAVWLASARANADEAPSPARSLTDAELVVCFQGKGSSLAYDAGVMDVAFDRIPALGANHVVLAGNSSGSIMATYFSCFGINETSVRYAAYILTRADVSRIRENEKGGPKAIKMFRGQDTELSHEELKEYLGFALGVNDWRSAANIADLVRRSRVVPKLPLVIVSGNAEIIDNRGPRHPFDPKNQKIFDEDTFDVFWKPEVYDFYRAHPDRFSVEHPNLRLGDSPYIGKACTYFVNRAMYDLLRRVPAAERQGDLRLLETPADLALAIEASVSEPSYFKPVVEIAPAKLTSRTAFGDLGNTRRRSYCGGFIMPLIGQDVRRSLPHVRIMGTGWNPVPYTARLFLRDWYLVDIRPIAHKNLWWADLEIHSTREFQKKVVNREMSQQEEFEAGQERALECLTADVGMPEYVEYPRFSQAVADAVRIEPRVDATESLDGGARLETMRGLGGLISSQDTSATTASP